MKILVTGGAGYVGSHACKALKLKGHEPTVFDNLVYGHRDFVKWGPLVEGDLLDPVSLGEVFAKNRFDALMHFAAYTYVGESVSDPAKYYRNNVAGTLNLLDCARSNGVNKIVFSSTCATYGVPRQVPIPEDHPQSPINPYGQTKLTVERMLADFDAAYGLKSVSLRYFNAAGADTDSEIGEAHDPETHLIPLVLDAATGKRPGITVYGSDYDTPDGTCIRDYIHVSDLAQAHCLALEYLAGGGHTTAFNLGCGTGYSVREVIDAAIKVTGKKIPQKTGPRRPGDPPRLVGSSDKAKEVLGWAPKRSDIEAIITDAWRWHLKRFSK